MAKRKNVTDYSQVIDLVRPYEYLYNREHVDFKNKELKERIWGELGAKHLPKLSGAETYSRWKSCRDHYSRLKRDKAKKRSGDAASREPEWEYYKDLSFLDSFKDVGETETTLKQKPVDSSGSSSSDDQNSQINMQDSQEDLFAYPSKPVYTPKSSSKKPKQESQQDPYYALIKSVQERMEQKKTENSFSGAISSKLAELQSLAGFEERLDAETELIRMLNGRIAAAMRRRENGHAQQFMQTYEQIPSNESAHSSASAYSTQSQSVTYNAQSSGFIGQALQTMAQFPG
ncbi:cathepsin B [Aphelenchoides avenae]|nr:cathepsin B [Aphelenchus avenae]